MSRTWPACPSCGATDERPPDALGVHRCPACAIEFRPPGRMPIRGAPLPAPYQPNSLAGAWGVVIVIVGALLGLAVALGDHEAALPPPIVVQAVPPPSFDPALLEGLDALGKIEIPAALAPIVLDHEVHRSQLDDGRLFATGLITASSFDPIDEVTVEVGGRDRSGASLWTRRAVVSCERMQAGESCAWMIDEEVPSSVAELEFFASGRRDLGLGLPRFELRSDRTGELQFDAKQGVVRFAIRERSVLGGWATVTAYDPQGHVLGVAKTRWPDRLQAGRQRMNVAVPETSDEVARHELRVGGFLPDW